MVLGFCFYYFRQFVHSFVITQRGTKTRLVVCFWDRGNQMHVSLKVNQTIYLLLAGKNKLIIGGEKATRSGEPE